MIPLLDTARRYPDGVALISGTGNAGTGNALETLTWGALANEARRMAGALRQDGVSPESVVAVHLAGTRDQVVLLHAIWFCGAVCAPLNLRLSDAELIAQITHLRPLLTVVDEMRSYHASAISTDQGSDTTDRNPSHTSSAKDFRRLPLASLQKRARGIDPAAVEIHEPADEDICSILFTSGTVGRLKAVPHSWANHRASAAASAANLGEEPSDVWQCAIPLYHIGGLAILLRSLFTGMAVRLHARFDPDEVLTALRHDGVTITSLVPTMLHRMMERDAMFRASALPALRAILLGGASAHRALWDEALRRGLPVLGTYGLTESCSQVVTGSPATISEDAYTAGRPLQGVEIEIRDAQDRPLASGKQGEILLRGPMLTRGYLHMTFEAASEDGWFRTGDIGHLDARGCLVVAARREDLIISGGENVVPQEIEDVLLRHDAVEDAAVVGLPDEEWGERVAAALVLRGDVRIDDIVAACRSALAGYKVPRSWHVIESLPRTASGKLRRAEVRARLVREENDQRTTPMYR